MEYKIINPVVIRQSMMNNDNMIKQFIELYIIQSPVDFENLKKAMSEKNHTIICAAAHHIKPTMEYIGASELRINFQELERLANQKENMDKLDQKYDEIKPKFELLIQELKEYISKL